MYHVFFIWKPYKGHFHPRLPGSISLFKSFTNHTNSISQLLFSKSNFFEKMSEKIYVTYKTSAEDYIESMEDRNMREKTVWDKQLFREFLRKENVETETYMITPTEFKECRTEFITSFTGHTCFSLFTLYFNCTRKWQNISQNTVVYFPNLNFAQFWWDICKFKSGINSSCSIPLTFKLLVYSH